MTESKSTRDYIKNWGRTAAREHTSQSFQVHQLGLHIGKVSVDWSEDNDFQWTAHMKLDSFYSADYEVCTSESRATAAVHRMYNNLMKKLSFGEWLQIMCKRHQMTTAGLAERLGVTRQTVHYWVKGTRQCGDLYIYNQIAALFADLEEMSHRDMLGHMSLLFRGDR